MKKHEIPELNTSKITAYLWLALGVLALCGVIFKQAWWHLFTAAICAVFFVVFKHEAEMERER